MESLLYKWYVHWVVWGEREEGFYVDACGYMVQRQDEKSKWIGDEKSNIQNCGWLEVGKWQFKKNPMYKVMHSLTQCFFMKSIKFEYILKHGFKLNNPLMRV